MGTASSLTPVRAFYYLETPKNAIFAAECVSAQRLMNPITTNAVFTHGSSGICLTDIPVGSATSSRWGGASSWLAGGTDLLVGIRSGVRDPARVIDLKQIPELTAIEIDETAVRIGAAASAFDVLHNSVVPSQFPGLAEAVYQSTGRRFRDLPLNPPKIMAALANS